MKPISLIIKGLNSFIEPQEIDFETLTSKGIFGIFGPTGSGKSTILDGITLALYGDVARKSTNFMNTNCDSLTVSYEFQITEKEIKRYRVEREYRRDKKSDAVRSKSAKIISIEGENEIVLEEQAKAVTEKCMEIIGLKLEDFTRTVVLPQGNFSEFLKLDGKERRNMLERLFNLQKYGDELSFKLGSKMKKEREKAINLEGELKGYEDCSEDILEEQKKKLLETESLHSRYKKELEVAEEKFHKGKEVWELQLELKAEIEKEKELKVRENEIHGYEKSVSLGESALKIETYMKRYEDTFHEINTIKEELIDLKKNLEKLTIKREEQKNIYEAAKNRNENELSDLKIKRQQIIEAIDEEKVLISLQEETKILYERISYIEKELETINKKIKKNDLEMEKQNDEISKKEEEVETLKVSEEYKQKINEAVMLLNNYENLIEQKEQLKKEVNALSSELERGTLQRDSRQSELHKSKENIKEKKEVLEVLEKNCPGNQDMLMDMQNEFLKKKEDLGKYKKYLEEINEYETMMLNLKEKLSHYEKERSVVKKEEESLKNKIKEIETQNIAHILRRSLSNEQACPVCGSTEHPLKNAEIIEYDNLEELKVIQKQKETKLQELLTEMARITTNLENLENRKKENKYQLTALGDEFKYLSVLDLEKEFTLKKSEIEEYNSKKSDLEKEIKIFLEESNKIEISYIALNTSIGEKEEQLKKQHTYLSSIADKHEEVKTKIEEQKKEMSVFDFVKKRDEISQMETSKAKLNSEIKDLRIRVKKLSEERTILSNIISKFREELQEKKTSYYEKSKQIEEKRSSIALKVGETKDLENTKENTSNLIAKIEKEYLLAEKEKNEIEEKFQECNNKIITTQNSQISMSKRFETDKEELKNALDEEKFKDIQEVKENLISKSKIERLKTEIEQYRNSIIRAAVAIDNLHKKQKGRSLIEEEWIGIQKEREVADNKLKSYEKEKIKMEERVKSLIEKVKRKQELLLKKSKFDHKLAILGDLESLFRGKKFVEFVATNQLKYVSLEASKKLKEITGGTYGLEVDENGKFLIRDYKNGGAARDATTLSGGETFLASLSLALALSTQIQLKGTAPLEFFFLDEGFGTLDDNLLEVVMDSLEKIHNDKLSIGIISHLEAIKNRIPVKILVTPAEAGMGGSKVKIE